MTNFPTLKNFILDILFPISCLGCKRADYWLCSQCLSRIPLKLDQICPICEKKTTPDGRVCFSCRRKSSLDGLLVTTSYKNELVIKAVHYLKYRFIENLSEPLGEILMKAVFNSQIPLPDLIMPVPLHQRRLRWRGFNQAELLANYLGNNLTPGFEIPVINNLLIRKKYTYPQMEIKNYFRRKENLKNAFEINVRDNTPISCGRKKWEYGRNILNGGIVLLVDDIATTGATLFECAKTLKQNGAKSVFAVVVARQEYKKN